MAVAMATPAPPPLYEQVALNYLEPAAALGRRVRQRGRPQSTAIITSDAFTTTMTLAPFLMPSSSTASFVIDDVMILPPPMSTRTCAVVAPVMTLVTVPLI